MTRLRRRMVWLALGLACGCGEFEKLFGGEGKSDAVLRDEAAVQMVMGIVVGFLLPAASRKPQVTQNCSHGGSFSIGTDGSFTFNNCSFAPMYSLDGRLRIQTSPDGSRTTVEFDRFNGQNGDKLFEMDGTITETHKSNGDIDFNMDIDSAVTDAGSNRDETNVHGNLTVKDAGGMVGTLQLNSLRCDFSGQSVYAFQTDEGGKEVIDEACEEQEGAPPS